MPLIRPAKWDDCQDLAPRLRKEDVAEVEAIGRTPLETLQVGYKMSDQALVIEDKCRPVCMYGTTPMGHSVGSPWFLGAPEVSQVALFFMRETKAYIKSIKARYRHLTNLIDGRNTEHLRWLLWCGFELTGETRINDFRFLQFYMRGDYV